MHRRDFLQLSLSASAASLLRIAPPKKILVLGGTTFLGPAVVESAVVAGHTVTLFNRGITNPGLFPDLEKLRGLRSATATEENLGALRGRRWDAIIDTWPHDPVVVESAARFLRDQTSQYLYVSSIAAYEKKNWAIPGLTEAATLNPWDMSISEYNRGKAESERRLHPIFGDRLTIVRPGAIKGARDDTPDLAVWLRRAQVGGRHIGPGTGEDHVQNVDVKDVGRFLIMAIDRSLTGTYNLIGETFTFRQLVAQCNEIMRSNAEFVWMPQAFLHAQGIDPAPYGSPDHPWYLGKLPYWHPEPEYRGFFQMSSQKALNAGWRRRPFTEMALDYMWSMSTISWTDELSADEEAQVLARFKA
jgi:2'-hydroxyisoflavone reductase